MAKVNQNPSHKISKFNLEKDSTAEALLNLVSHKDRFLKSTAINFVLEHLFSLTEQKGISKIFFTDESIVLLRNGLSPVDVLKRIQHESQSDQVGITTDEKPIKDDEIHTHSIDGETDNNANSMSDGESQSGDTGGNYFDRLASSRS